MKKLIVMAVMVAMGLQIQAQIVSSRSSMVTREVIDRGGWSTFGVEYLPSTFVVDGGDNLSFTGLALNYTNAISITGSVPLFFEWGVGAQYSFKSEEKNGLDRTMNFISVKVPLNVIYDFALPDSKIHFDPFAGIQFRGNIWGQEKVEYRNESETIDLFDSDEGDCKRFQVGVQAGLKVRFDKSFFVGIGYGVDLNEFGEKIKINELKLMGGLVF